MNDTRDIKMNRPQEGDPGGRKDWRPLLFGPTDDHRQRRRTSAAVTRRLHMLRAHGLIHKVPRRHRYVVSEKG